MKKRGSWMLGLQAARALGTEGGGDRAAEGEGEGEGEGEPVFSYQASECGGFFQPVSGAESGADAFDADTYCGAERLIWSYADGKLALTDQRILLNCCGDHSVQVTRDEDGTLVVTELDAPEDGWGRCDCLCVYDYAVTIDLPVAEPVALRLERLVTESEELPSGSAELVWEGTLDLTAGSGDEVLDETDLGFWCQEPGGEGEGEGEFEFRSSACGGFAAAEPPAPSGNDAEYGGGYCDAEVLHWSFAAGTLQLTDSRVLPNCCGDHTATVSRLEDGTLEVVQRDDPLNGWGRCACMCVFDFELTIPDVVGDSLSLVVKRVIGTMDDSQLEEQVTVFTGTLDLTAGAGQEIVDETDVGPWCNEPVDSGNEEPVFSARASACGGFAGEAVWGEEFGAGGYEGDYCDAEVLLWSLADGKLTLTDQRATLNCCGIHALEVSQDADGTYLITEVDSPLENGGRCFCMCVYDFEVVLEEVTGEQVALRLERQVLDQVGDEGMQVTTTPLFAGSLDLSAGSGYVILDSRADPFCQPAAIPE